MATPSGKSTRVRGPLASPRSGFRPAATVWTASAVACLLILQPGATSGTTYIIEFDQDITGLPDPGSATWPAEINLPKFDRNLGTLTAITLTLQGSATGDIGFENLQAGAFNTVDFTQPLTISYDFPTNPLNAQQTLTLAGSSGVLASYDGITDMAGASGITTSLTPDSDTSSITIDAADFPTYSTLGGAEQFRIALGADLGTTTVAGNGAKQYAYLSALSVTTSVRVSYTFESAELVPESSASLAALGFSALTLMYAWQRRRNHRATSA